MTKMQDKFLSNLSTSKNATQAAIKAGYSPKSAQVSASRMMNDEQLQKRIHELNITGLDTLEDVAKNGRNEIARVQAGKVLTETAMGKPKDNKSTFLGDVTINVNKISDQPPNIQLNS